jgi:hypothetical protein
VLQPWGAFNVPAPFTGVTPFVQTGRGLVACEPHQADYWVPVLKGKPLIVNGRALRYKRKQEAMDSLGTALLRRKPLARNYKLGARMAPPVEKN